MAFPLISVPVKSGAGWPTCAAPKAAPAKAKNDRRVMARFINVSFLNLLHTLIRASKSQFVQKNTGGRVLVEPAWTILLTVLLFCRLFQSIQHNSRGQQFWQDN